MSSTGPILIVDDDVDIRETLAETLEERGFAVITASNGVEALEVARAASPAPSAILLDLMMPILDGYGFLEERAKDPRLAAIPVAVVTASHGVDLARVGVSAPVVTKPFSLARLVGVLHDLRSSATGS